MSRMRRVLWTLLLLLAATGCHSWSIPRSLPPSPSASDRARIHQLAVVVAPPPAPHFDEPSGGVLWGLAAGAGAGLAVAVMIGASTGGVVVEGTRDDAGWAVVLFLIVWIPIAVVCVVGGALFGMFGSMSAAEVEQRHSVASAAWQGAGPDLGISDELKRALRADWPDLVVVDDPPADATLNVRIVEYGLAAGSGIDPSTTVVVVADVDLIVAGSERPYRSRIAFQSRARKFTEWTADEWTLGSELRLAASQLARRVADEVLLVEREVPR